VPDQQRLFTVNDFIASRVPKNMLIRWSTTMVVGRSFSSV